MQGQVICSHSATIFHLFISSFVDRDTDSVATELKDKNAHRFNLPVKDLCGLLKPPVDENLIPVGVKCSDSKLAMYGSAKRPRAP